MEGGGSFSLWKGAVIMRGEVMEEEGEITLKCLLHLHLVVESRAVLVRHMPETNENKAFTDLTADFVALAASPPTPSYKYTTQSHPS